MNLTIRSKLLFTVLIPIMGIILLALIQLADKKNQYDEAIAVEHVVQLSIKASELVHELQKERGMTASFLGSKGKNFANELGQQRTVADRQGRELVTFVDNFDFGRFDAELERQVQQALRSFAAINPVRNQVDSLSITVGSAIGAYTLANANLLELVGSATKQTANDSLNKAILGYFNFLQGKERAGVERAVLANVFSKNEFGTGQLAKLITLISEQDTYFGVFTRLTSVQLAAENSQLVNSSASSQVNAMRKVALTNAQLGEFNVSSNEWFSSASARINLLKQLENKIAVSIQTQANELAASAFSSGVILGSLCLLLVLVVLFFALYIVQKMVSQVLNLTDTIRQAEQNADLGVRAQVMSSDELGQTAQGFNQMMTKFVDVITRVGDSSEQLAATADETSVVSLQSNQIMARMQEETEQVAAAVNQMAASVVEVAHSTTTAAESAAQAVTRSEQGQKVVSDTIDGIIQVSEIVGEIRDDVSDLANNCNQIGSILEVIRQIADQTNLLALNAAIEAARAGESGRGFAVVADEVRSLAKRTQDSVAEIQLMTESLQAGADKAMTSIQRGHDQSDLTVTQARHAGDALDAILASVTEITDMNNQIAAATEEQTAVTEQISQSVVSISDTGRETVSGSSQVVSASEELAQLASTLKTIVGQFKLVS